MENTNNKYISKPYRIRSLQARTWSEKHQFDRIKMEYICRNVDKDYHSKKDFPEHLKVKHDKHSYIGGWDTFAEPFKAENTWLEMEDLDILCKQLAQILIRERGEQGFIRYISVHLYHGATKRTVALKRFHYD